jgi:hypothetical protein
MVIHIYNFSYLEDRGGRIKSSRQTKIKRARCMPQVVESLPRMSEALGELQGSIIPQTTR